MIKEHLITLSIVLVAWSSHKSKLVISEVVEVTEKKDKRKINTIKIATSK